MDEYTKLPDSESFEVWERRLKTGRLWLHTSGFKTVRGARLMAEEYNAEEIELARMELRKVAREFFVVRTIGQRKEVK